MPVLKLGSIFLLVRADKLGEMGYFFFPEALKNRYSFFWNDFYGVYFKISDQPNEWKLFFSSAVIMTLNLNSYGGVDHMFQGSQVELIDHRTNSEYEVSRYNCAKSYFPAYILISSLSYCLFVVQGIDSEASAISYVNI